MKSSKLIISTIAILMLVVSCGKQSAPPVSPEDTKALASAKESADRMGLEQNDVGINISDEVQKAAHL